MSECHQIDRYLDHSLAPEELSRFKQHLPGCVHCQTELHDWSMAAGRLGEWAEFKQGPQPTVEAASDLVAKAQVALQQHPVKAAFSRNTTIGIVATAAAAAIALVLWQPFSPAVGPEMDAPVTGRTFAQSSGSEAIPRGVLIDATEKTEFLRVGVDRIAVIKEGNARVVELSNHQTMVTLGRGTAVFDVVPITTAHRFTVSVGNVNIAVKGTAFSVTLDKSNHVTVVVARDLVEVRTDHLKITVGADQKWTNRPQTQGEDLTTAPGTDVKFIESTLSLGPKARSAKAVQKRSRKRKRALAKATPEPEETKIEEPDNKPVDYNSWRRQITSGQHQAAAREISHHLETDGNDHKAWSLLADAERKGRNWKRAVASYDQVIQHSSGTTAHRARYMAADIYQNRLGDHASAVRLLEDYLKTAPQSGSQYNIAKVHLARSLAKLGQKQKAIATLKEVLANKPSSFVASNARSLLSELEAHR